MNPKTRKLLFPALLALLVAALVYWTTNNDESSTTPPTVRIGFLNITASLPLFIAEEKGFLSAEGLEYEAFVAATSNHLVDGVVAGSFDCYIESSAVPVLAFELQSPGRLKIFACSAITSEAPFDALLVKKNSAIQDLADLAGKKIGVFPGSTATNLLRKFLSDKGLDAKITFVPIPPHIHLTALLEGSIDALHCYEPTTAIALVQGKVRQIYGSIYAEQLSKNPQGVAVISAEFVRKHPDVARKTIKALERAMKFMREEESEARWILEKRLELDKTVAARTVFLYMLPHREIDMEVLQEYANMLSDLGELKSRIDVNGGIVYGK